MKSLPPLYTELGSLIRKARMNQSLSMEELAWRCSLHPNAIWKVEKAKTEIKLSTLIKIFHELDISFNELQKLAPHPKK